MPWQHVYDPLGWPAASTLVALLPLAVLLGLLAFAHAPALAAALAGLATALAIAIGVVGMPADAAVAAAVHGAAFGLFPIGWIVVTAMFLYRLCVEAGALEIMKRSVTSLSADHRLQALLIAFSFGAFLEGAAGFGAPVAISAALLVGAGFPAVEAACIALVANTAPVAFGALGTPIVTLAKVTGLDEQAISALAGRQLPIFSLLVPAWMVAMMAGWRGLAGVWPAVIVCGVSFAAVQFAMSNYVGPALVDVVGGVASLVALAAFLRVWRPRDIWQHGVATLAKPRRTRAPTPVRAIVWAWMPWAFLSAAVFTWGLPPVKAVLEGRPASATSAAILPQPLVAPEFPVPLLDGRVAKVPPATREAPEIERAVYRFNWLSAAGTGILAAALLSIPWLGIPWRRAWAIWWRTLRGLATALATIAAMLALAFVTRYSGTDVTLGLALTRTGPLYPFFAPLLGWLGVALTGSDTSSNAMFGSLQRVTAEQLGLDPLLTCTANSTGGVMGKMIDAQSIVVAATATGTHRAEGTILRRVFPHSLALAVLMGVLVWLQAGPLAWMVPRANGAEGPSATRWPNVLMIAVDDLRPELGCYGAAGAVTPHLDRLAARGVRFDRAYCNIAVCGASRASLLKGLWPTPQRFRFYDTRADVDAPDVPSLPLVLKRHGYTTVSNGKVYHHRDDDVAAWSAPPWRPVISGGAYQLPENEPPPGAKRRGAAWEAADAPDDRYSDHELGSRTIADLDRLAKQEAPFFLACGFARPHLPFVAPRKYWDLHPADAIRLPANPQFPTDLSLAFNYEWGELRAYRDIPAEGPVSDETARNLIRGYRASVSFMDAQVGRLLDALDRLGIADDTVIVLWGDHGWQLGDHGMWCKHTNFEVATRTPLLVVAPGVAPGRDCSRLVEFVDLYPTLCDLCGVPRPDHLQGKSFTPLLADVAAPHKRAIFTRYGAGEAVRTDTHRLMEVRTRHGAGEPLARGLFDLEADPHENTDISGDVVDPYVVLGALLREHRQSREGAAAAAP